MAKFISCKWPFTISHSLWKNKQHYRYTHIPILHFLNWDFKIAFNTFLRLCWLYKEFSDHKIINIVIIFNYFNHACCRYEFCLNFKLFLNIFKIVCFFRCNLPIIFTNYRYFFLKKSTGLCVFESKTWLLVLMRIVINLYIHTILRTSHLLL